jgi:hypothetical protein
MLDKVLRYLHLRKEPEWERDFILGNPSAGHRNPNEVVARGIIKSVWDQEEVEKIKQELLERKVTVPLKYTKWVE